jgi:hypothetical protein
MSEPESNKGVNVEAKPVEARSALIIFAAALPQGWGSAGGCKWIGTPNECADCNGCNQG